MIEHGGLSSALIERGGLGGDESIKAGECVLASEPAVEFLVIDSRAAIAGQQTTEAANEGVLD